jgi:antirestriction protein ArdC
MKNLHQQVTDQILNSIDAAGEWKPCWIGAPGIPKNGVTGRRYNGINILVLWCAAMAKGYSSSKWATYQQWQEAGGQVKKGERSTVAVLYKTVEKQDNPDERYRLSRAFNLFNAAQVEGIATVEAPQFVTTWEQHDAAEQMIRRTGARLEHRGHQPCYVPAIDTIWMPERQHFVNSEGYYATAFHELAHWTGAKGRLDRDMSTKFKTASYAMEELVAELASSFVMSELEMTSRIKEEAASYIRHWRDAMKADNTAIFTAAAAASKAADYVMAGSVDCASELIAEVA